MNLFKLFESTNIGAAPNVLGVQTADDQHTPSPIGSGTSKREAKKKPVTMMGIGIAEGAVKELHMDIRELSAGEFYEKYKRTKRQMLNSLNSPTKPVRSAPNKGVAESDPGFERMMGGITSSSALNTREAMAMIQDLVYQGGASYQEALHQASTSFNIDPAKLDALSKQQGLAEAGPFSYGAKKPRKGSVADLAAQKRKEQDKGKQPIEPKDQRVGTARVTKGVAEGAEDSDEYHVLRHQTPQDIEHEMSPRAWTKVKEFDSYQDAQAAYNAMKAKHPNNRFTVTTHSKKRREEYKNRGVSEGEGDPEGVPHLTKELLSHIVQQVGTEGAHAIVKSLEWGDGAAKELLHLIVKDLKNNISMAESVKQRLDPKCWTGKHKEGTKIKGGVRVNNCVPNESIEESKERCMQCGMTNCTCKPGTCKCKPIAGWIPNKGFKKGMDEAANPAQQAAIAIAKKKKQGVSEAAQPWDGKAVVVYDASGANILDTLDTNTAAQKYSLNPQDINAQLKVQEYTTLKGPKGSFIISRPMAPTALDAQPGFAESAQNAVYRRQIAELKGSIRAVKEGILDRAAPKLPKPRNPAEKVLRSKVSAAGSHTNKKRQQQLQPKHKAKDTLDESIENHLMQLRHAGYDIKGQ